MAHISFSPKNAGCISGILWHVFYVNCYLTLFIPMCFLNAQNIRIIQSNTSNFLTVTCDNGDVLAILFTKYKNYSVQHIKFFDSHLW